MRLSQHEKLRAPERLVLYANCCSLTSRAQCSRVYLRPRAWFQYDRPITMVDWIGLGGLTRGMTPPPARYVFG